MHPTPPEPPTFASRAAEADARSAKALAIALDQIDAAFDPDHIRLYPAPATQTGPVGDRYDPAAMRDAGMVMGDFL